MRSRRSFVKGTLAAVGAVVLDAVPVLARKRRRKRRKPEPLFLERFRRRDAEEWGWPWFNERYGRRWSIDSRRGIYYLPPAANPAYYRPNPILVLDHDVTDVDIRATISLSNPTARGGVLARAVGYGSYYAAYLGHKNVLRVTRCEPLREKRLGKAPILVEANQRYRLRLQVKGSGPVVIRAKAWLVGVEEPEDWMVEEVDASTNSLIGRGPFGVFAEHAVDGRGSTLRVIEVVAWSEDRRSMTSPSIAYALAGVPDEHGTFRAVAKTAVPASIGFEVGGEPTLTQGVARIPAQRARRDSLTSKAVLDIAALPPGAPAYWRAYAERRGARVTGPTHTFRKGPARGLPVRFAFGACTRWQSSPHPSFEQVRLKVPDFFLHQGDLGYAYLRVIDHERDTYQDHWVRMLMDPNFQAMTRALPVSLKQDDADYGRNNADGGSVRRFTIGAFGALNANPRNSYFHFRYGDVAVFVLDTRRFSTGKGLAESERSKLGAEQKAWLLEGMTTAAGDEAVGLLVVASPQAFGSDNKQESWRRGYPAEWQELISFFENLDAPVLIVSGDAHGHRLHEFPQRNLAVNVPRIVEFVSAGTEAKHFDDYVDPLYLLRAAKGPGFGLVELGPEEEVGGHRKRTLSLTAVRSKDGGIYWRAQYMVVRGVGIFPAGAPEA